jgi:hypothetical protein
MKKLFPTLAVLIAVMLPLVLVLGCGEDEEAGPAGTVQSTDPADGAEMAANATLKITFDNVVKDVKVNGNAATGSNKSWTWAATGLTPGQDATLTIEWTNDDDSTDSKSITVKVQAEDTTPPQLVSSTISDGDTDVDYEAINTDAVIELEFDEPIADARDVALMVDDTTVKWKVSTDGNKVVLDKLSGGELSAETEYKIEGPVEDGAGNTTEVSITFTTKAKEE